MILMIKFAMRPNASNLCPLKRIRGAKPLEAQYRGGGA